MVMEVTLALFYTMKPSAASPDRRHVWLACRVKGCLDILIEPLEFLFNFSLESNIFL